MEILLIILLVSVICAVFALLLIAVSIGIGSFMAFLIPSLTITHTITAGAVITTFIFYCFVKLFSSISKVFDRMGKDTSSDSDEDEDDELPNARDARNKAPIYITPSSFIPKSKSSSTRRKRKSSDDSDQ